MRGKREENGVGRGKEEDIASDLKARRRWEVIAPGIGEWGQSKVGCAKGRRKVESA